MADKPPKLYRSEKNRVLCGVCGGIAEYFDVDPIIVRLLWAVLSLASVGIGVLVYIIACLVIPSSSKGR